MHPVSKVTAAVQAFVLSDPDKVTRSHMSLHLNNIKHLDLEFHSCNLVIKDLVTPQRDRAKFSS